MNARSNRPGSTLNMDMDSKIILKKTMELLAGKGYVLATSTLRYVPSIQNSTRTYRL